MQAARTNRPLRPLIHPRREGCVRASVMCLRLLAPPGEKRGFDSRAGFRGSMKMSSEKTEIVAKTGRDLLPLTCLFRATDKQIVRSMREDEPLEYLRGDAVVRVSFEIEARSSEPKSNYTREGPQK